MQVMVTKCTSILLRVAIACRMRFLALVSCVAIIQFPDTRVGFCENTDLTLNPPNPRWSSRPSLELTSCPTASEENKCSTRTRVPYKVCNGRHTTSWAPKYSKWLAIFVLDARLASVQNSSNTNLIAGTCSCVLEYIQYRPNKRDRIPQS